MTMAVDQATQLRRLARQTSGATVIAVTSGKGGVGKSNIAVNLAIKLASAQKEVVLLDADLGLANADVLCNIDLPSNLSHFIARRKELADVMVEAPGGFKLIGGASGLARMADLTDVDRQRLIDSLAELESRTDVILIDTGAGISPNVLSFTRCADQILVVTTPEPTAITDAYAVIKVQRPDEGRLVYERIAKVAKQFLSVQVLDAGYVPTDPEVPAAVRRRTPFLLASPRCAASQGIGQLAMRLQRGIGPATPGGFFNRMSRWFRK
jgi:flagellar biosynthesis protein FlhG